MVEAFSVSCSYVAANTVNPIRSIVDNLKVKPNPNKEMISLALGDPTVYGNFKIHNVAVEAVKKQIDSYASNGYAPAAGYPHAREAVAKYGTHPEAPLTKDDVILASGCSGALELCIVALANPGQNILLPRPGFSVYQTIANAKGIHVKYYDLLPEKRWEVDLQHMESLIDSNTAAILVLNPSNPCGSVYSREHLLSILKVVEKHRLPIIADEIYAYMTFQGEQFYPIASLTKTVPILSVGGLAKRHLVPGWRIGWILIHDRNNALSEVRKGLLSLTQLIIGCNTLIQGALPDILEKTPQSFYDETNMLLEKHANLSSKYLSSIPGLEIVMPQGAMYMMIGIKVHDFKDIQSDIDFSEKLVAEESVFCLPGQCFGYPNYIRIVFTAPEEKLKEAYDRIANFCSRHHK